MGVIFFSRAVGGWCYASIGGGGGVVSSTERGIEIPTADTVAAPLSEATAITDSGVNNPTLRDGSLVELLVGQV